MSDIGTGRESESAAVTEWPMWALRTDEHWPNDPGFFVYAFPDRHYPKAYADKGVEPVEVLVRLDDDGDYWGWMQNGGEYPEFIFHVRMAFEMCFTYGPQAEVDAGRGRIVRLAVMPANGRSVRP